MDEAVSKLVCPYCAANITVRRQAARVICPQCGQPLPEPAEVRASRSSPDGAEATGAPADAALVADLREAFSLEADALGSAGPCRLGRASHSSSLAGRGFEWEALASGSHLGDFEILGELGRGGMGVVYRARQLSLDRDVALKVLPGYARHGRTAVQRFRAEAQAAARLHHSNVVSFYAQGEHSGHFYYAMELVDGVSLDTVIQSRPDLLSSIRLRHSSSAIRWTGALATAPGPSPDATPEPAADQLPPAADTPWTPEDYRHIAALIAEVADALDYAHQRGVIHRDVKPHNLLLGQNDRLHLTDFGLARLLDSPHLTASGEVMGTPAYLSPEQIRGDADGVDHRTDIYSLGVTLYELVTRRKPFAGQTRDRILASICTTQPAAPRRITPELPTDLETICLRAMEKDPARRHPSAAWLAEDLRRFAEGRPILSRRTSRPEKALKWMRRHKALTAAITTTALVVALIIGLAWSVSAGRRHEAQQLLQAAYNQLAFFDYRAPELVIPDIERAAALGADSSQLHLVQALSELSQLDQQSAIRHLDSVLADDPDELRAWYLLAWAQWRERDFAASRATFAQAERRGPPPSADAWFFRGLAVHFDQPLLAIESYRAAIAARSRQHEFYPLAVLHLARARNQQLYETRCIDAFSESEASLRQLIDQGHYGAYPYYLLSIAHRLAAEVYRGSSGIRDDTLVQQHYAQALEWARRGQEVEPHNDRPLTAEAACLESMGRLEEALAARTRAIAVADADPKRCEGYHYRWRLHYWLGDLESAWDDVTAHAACAPDSPFYAHVYPALLLAEMGQLEAAREHARALASEAPTNAQAVLWSATCLRFLGAPAEADELLTTRADTVEFDVGLVPPQSPEWVRALYDFCRNGGTLTELETLAAETPTPWKLWGEAYFHSAARHLGAGERTTALEHFAKAYRSYDGEERYTFHAQVFLRNMNKDASWPAWINVSWNSAPAAGPGDERE